jgi:hypothetical protein
MQILTAQRGHTSGKGRQVPAYSMNRPNRRINWTVDNKK